MIIANAALFHLPPASAWLDVTVNTVPGGVTLSMPDGNVLSCQPDGRLETRPAGTAGAYEIARVESGKVIFRPGDAYVFLTVG